jgi:hypothetical protein
MTIQEIRDTHESMTAEQLEAEKHARDVQVAGLRAEMAEIRRLLDPRTIAKQREEMQKAIARGVPDVVLGVGGAMLKIGAQ